MYVRLNHRTIRKRKEGPVSAVFCFLLYFSLWLSSNAMKCLFLSFCIFAWEELYYHGLWSCCIKKTGKHWYVFPAWKSIQQRYPLYHIQFISVVECHYHTHNLLPKKRTSSFRPKASLCLHKAH